MAEEAPPPTRPARPTLEAVAQRKAEQEVPASDTRPEAPSMFSWLGGIFIGLFFFSSVQLFFIGILGEYIGRIYEEVRNRPKYIVDRAEGLEPRRRP